MTLLPGRALAAVFAVAGVLHFTHTDAFASVVPPRLGDADLLVRLSGVAELTVAALLVPRRTQHLGGYLAAVLLVAVWPANVYAAIRGGYGAAPSPMDTNWAAWLRVPLQLPLIWLSWKVGRSEIRTGGRRTKR